LVFAESYFLVELPFLSNVLSSEFLANDITFSLCGLIIGIVVELVATDDCARC